MSAAQACIVHGDDGFRVRGVEGRRAGGTLRTPPAKAKAPAHLRRQWAGRVCRTSGPGQAPSRHPDTLCQWGRDRYFAEDGY